MKLAVVTRSDNLGAVVTTWGYVVTIWGSVAAAWESAATTWGSVAASRGYVAATCGSAVTFRGFAVVARRPVMTSAAWEAAGIPSGVGRAPGGVSSGRSAFPSNPEPMLSRKGREVPVRAEGTLSVRETSFPVERDGPVPLSTVNLYQRRAGDLSRTPAGTMLRSPFVLHIPLAAADMPETWELCARGVVANAGIGGPGDRKVVILG